MDSSLNPIKYDIWGCCVSRDIFGIGGESHSKIISYCIRNSFISAFSENKGPSIQFQDLLKYGKNRPDYERRCAFEDYSRNILSKLSTSDAEWLIIDFRYMIYGLDQYLFSNESVLVTPTIADYLNAYLTEHTIAYEKKHIDLYSFDYMPFLNKLIDFCKKRYGSHIILIQTVEAPYRISQDSVIISNSIDPKKDLLKTDVDTYFLKQTGCYYVPCPYNIISDDLHKWGLNEVHYPPEYYMYAKNVITEIVNNPGCKDLFKKISSYYSEICLKLSKILTRVELPATHIERDYNQFIKNKQYGAAKSLVTTIINSLNKDEPIHSSICAILGKSYRDGLINNPNGLEAIYWLRRAADEDPYMIPDLALLLLKNPSSYKEAYERCFQVHMKVGGAAQILGRMYRHGLYVGKDLFKAAEYTREAVMKNVGWATNELFDILWEINTPESLKEMIALGTHYANRFDAGAMGRLGRAYREGRGVSKDLSQAKYWMKKASEINPNWIPELIDLLLVDPQGYDEALQLVESNPRILSQMNNKLKSIHD